MNLSHNAHVLNIDGSVGGGRNNDFNTEGSLRSPRQSCFTCACGSESVLPGVPVLSDSGYNEPLR